MYKLIASKYENLKYDKEVLNMILDILKDEKNSYKVLEALAINQKNNGIGLSKAMMYKTIKISVNHASGEKYTYISRKIAEKIIYLLLGAGLICYDIKTKEIFYSLTQRGAQICQLLKNDNLININN